MTTQINRGEHQQYDPQIRSNLILHWRQVALLLPLLVGLLLFVHHERLSRSGHMFLQAMIVLLVYHLLVLGK